MKSPAQVLVAIILLLSGCGSSSDGGTPSTLVHSSESSSLVAVESEGQVLFDLTLAGTKAWLDVYEPTLAADAQPSATLHELDLIRIWALGGLDQVFEAQLSATDSNGERISRELLLSHPRELSPNTIAYRAALAKTEDLSGDSRSITSRASATSASVVGGSNSQLIIRDPFGALSIGEAPVTLVKTPSVELMLSPNLEFITNDKDSGARSSFSAYRVVPPEGFFVLSSVFVQTREGEPVEGTPRGLVIRAPLDDGNPMPILSAPLGYSLIWNDHESGTPRNSAFWRPISPSGYTCLGMLITNTYIPPFDLDYRCVRSDLVEPSVPGQVIYTDVGSGAKLNVSVIEPNPQPELITDGLTTGVPTHQPSERQLMQPVLQSASNLRLIQR